jgi:mannosylglycerate hydrolase
MPFDVVTRPVPKPSSDNWTEPVEPSDPQVGFLDVTDGNDGLAILNIGLYEAEVLDDDHKTMAVTLLRSFYQHGNWTKDRWPDEGFQNPGRHTFKYSIYPHEGNWLSGNVYHELSLLENPLICVQHGKGNHGYLPLDHSLVSVSEELQLSCLKQSEDKEALILRIYNPSSLDQLGRISFSIKIREAWLTDLEENLLEKVPVSNSVINLKVGHHKIVTLKIIRGS